jgi:recombinational DNA repair protein RecT
MQAKIVYANDTYSNNGVDKAPTHSQQVFGDKGEVVGAYCVVKLPNGDYLTEEMDKAKLDEVRATSKSTTGKGAQYSPWNTFPEEMMRKTVVKRAAKYWPSPKGEMNVFNKAVDVINEHEGLEQEPEILYTEEEHAEFMRMIKDSLAFSLLAYMNSCDEEKQTALFSSFPKGEISSNKAKVRELLSVGRSEWEAFTVAIRDMIKEEDISGLTNELEGFEIYEKKQLATLLGEPDTTTLKELLNNG